MSKISSNLSMRTEIESYRRKINTFIIFLNQIGLLWWNRKFPFKDDFVMRPSKSGDKVRSLLVVLKADLKRIAPEVTHDHGVTNIELKVSLKEIEMLKQNLAECIMLWIDCDGRDTRLRRRRYCVLARNYVNIRIENFPKLKSLIKIETEDKLKLLLDDKYADIGFVTSGDVEDEMVEVGIHLSGMLAEYENVEVPSTSNMITGDFTLSS